MNAAHLVSSDFGSESSTVVFSEVAFGGLMKDPFHPFCLSFCLALALPHSLSLSMTEAQIHIHPQPRQVTIRDPLRFDSDSSRAQLGLWYLIEPSLARSSPCTRVLDGSFLVL